MIEFGDLIRETCTGTGTGPVSLGGSPDGLHFPFSSQIAAGSSVFYTLWDGDNSNVEVGQGQYNSGGNSITRNFVEISTNGNDFINLSANPHTIELTWPAEAANFIARTTVGMRVGCQVTYDSTDGWKVNAGVLGIQDTAYTNTATIAGAGTTGRTALSTYYLYAYAAPDGETFLVEESTIGPVATALEGVYAKSGDATRRLLCWFRTEGVGAIVPFGTTYSGSVLVYVYADPIAYANVFNGVGTADAWAELTTLQQFAPVCAGEVHLQPRVTLLVENDETIVALSGYDPSVLAINYLMANSIVSFAAAKNTDTNYGNNIVVDVDPSGPQAWLWVHHTTGVGTVNLSVSKVIATL